MARDCTSVVREALGDEGFDGADVESVIVRVNEIRERIKAQGSVDNFDAKVRELIEQEGEKAKIAAALQRKQQAINILKGEQLRLQLNSLVEAGGLKPHEAFLALMEGAQKGVAFARSSVYATRLAFETRYVGRMMGEVEKVVPHFRSLVDDPEFNKDIVREMYELRAGGTPGKSGNTDAAAVAKVYAKYAEVSRTDSNRLGAGIGKLDGWAGPQRHAAEKMARVAQEDWVDKIIKELNWSKTFPELTDEKAVRRELRSIYRTIITGRDSSQTKVVEGKRPANLANSLAKTRVLHFKDADAWLRYNDEFGGGNITAAMLAHQQHISSTNAQMQVFGTNPENMLAQLLDDWQVKIRDDPNMSSEEKAKLASKLSLGTAGQKSTAVGKALLEMQGSTLATPNIKAAQINQGIRNVQAMAKLGGAVITAAPTDFFMTAFASMFRGGGFWRGFTRQLGNMLEGRSSAEQRELMFLLNEGADGMIQAVQNINLPNDGIPGGLSKLTNTFFQMTGLTWWTDTVRFAAAKTASAELGMRAKQGWSELPNVYRTLLQQRGINEAKWNVIRSAPFKAVNGTEYVTSDAVDGIADEALDGLIAPKLSDFEDAQAERLAQLEEANVRETGWLDKRRQRLDEKLTRANEYLDELRSEKDARTADRVEEIKARIDLLKEYQGQAETLSDIVSGKRMMDVRDRMLKERKAAGAERRLGRATGALATEYLRAGEKIGKSERRVQELQARIRQIEKKNIGSQMNADKRMSGFFNQAVDDFVDFKAKIKEREAKRMAEIEAMPTRREQAVERLRKDARLELELDIGKFIADEVNFAVIETDAASRRMVLQGTQAGTLTGEVHRYLTQFKGFPVAFTQRVLGRSVYFDSSKGRRGRDLGVLIAGLTAAGYLSMTAKDFLKGNYPPRDPSDPKVLLAAALQGGALGIYGDFLFGEANRFGNSPLENLAGPVPATGANIIGLYQKSVRGEAGAGEALNLVVQNTPFANLWYTKPALDYMILDSAREWASPGWRARRAQRLRKEYGQDRLW